MDKLKLISKIIVRVSLITLMTSKILMASPQYSLKDLQILNGEKNYLEFLKHAKDVRPSKRDESWKKMTKKMGVDYLKKVIERKQIDLTTYNFVEFLSNWPIFTKDLFFQLKREDFVISYFQKCLKKNKMTQTSCLTKMKKFWSASRKPPELGLKMANLINKNFKNEDLRQYIQKIPNSQVAEFYCSTPLIYNFLVDELKLILSKKNNEFDTKVEIQTLASRPCWDKIIGPLKEAMMKSPKKNKGEEAFLTLHYLGALSQIEREQFLVLFILKGPINGETFNLAWNTVQNLGQNHSKRKSIVAYLKTMDPLPDELFAISDLKKKLHLLDILSQNIPEYLDHYAKTCLNFYKGIGKYPKGNPTLYCRDFFKLSNGKRWVNPKWLLEFKNLTKL